jgi:hypothetical protein
MKLWVILMLLVLTACNSGSGPTSFGGFGNVTIHISRHSGDHRDGSDRPG